VYLGVTKRLLTRLKTKKYEIKCHLSRSNLIHLNEKFEFFSKHVPSEFNRKFDGGLNSLAYWKATEY